MKKSTPGFEKPDAEIQSELPGWSLQDLALRPKSLDEFVGQDAAKETLKVAIGAAKKRGDLPDHILFAGPPGLGKTTLAAIVAGELGAEFRQTSAPAIGKPGDMASILTSIDGSLVLFIDEIHRLNAVTSELLYTAMEDFALDLMVGEGARGRAIRLDIPPFTLIGATTRAGALASPLMDRFGIKVQLDYYNDAQLLKILERDAGLLGIEPEVGALERMSVGARGTPRIAKNLLRRARDWASEKTNGRMSPEGVEDCLTQLGVDDKGLDGQDRRYLQYLATKTRGRAVGLNTIAAALTEDPITIETVIEPYLLKVGFIERTSRGRLIMPAGEMHVREGYARAA
jgi:Holliday junction DNA helicase RuvB